MEERARNIGEEQGGDVESQAGVGEQAMEQAGDMEQAETFEVTPSAIVSCCPSLLANFNMSM